MQTIRPGLEVRIKKDGVVGIVIKSYRAGFLNTMFHEVITPAGGRGPLTDHDLEPLTASHEDAHQETPC